MKEREQAFRLFFFVSYHQKTSFDPLEKPRRKRD